MSDRIGPEAMAELEDQVRRDPGCEEFPVLAELHRRDGRLTAAEAVARRGLEHRPDCTEGLLVLALALLELDRVDSARELLADRAAELLPASPGVENADDLAVVDFDDDVSDGELEEAFAHAALDREQLIDADAMAHQAMRAAELDEPEIPAVESADPIFATRTMAEVLERQGDVDGAERIRAAMAPETVGPWPRTRHQAVIATLESWLTNLRRIER